METSGVGVGHELITVSTSALAFASIPTDANAALIRTETNDVRISLDSTAPTAAIGYLLKATDTTGLWIAGRGCLLNFKTIRAGAADGTLQVQYFAI
jgi:hypothetical protein